MTCTKFNKSHLIDNRRRQKYTPVLKTLLNGDVINIHPDYAPLYGNSLTISCSSISNKETIEQFLDGPKNEDAKSWPAIECDSGSVKIFHLQKTGQFSKSNCVSFTDTDIKESLVLLFYHVLKKGYKQASHIFTKDSLIGDILEISPLALSLGISMNATLKLNEWLNDQFCKPTTDAATVMQLSFSQACRLHEAYPTSELDRTSTYKQIRSLAYQATNIRADKWNPGDVYVIINAQSPMLSCIQQQEGYVPPIQEINNLFADSWTDSNKPLVSVSLKLSSWSFGGKCKSAIRMFGDDPSKYHITSAEKATSNNLLIDAISTMRSMLANHSPTLIYKGPLDWNNANQKVQEKFAVLKLLCYLINVNSDFTQTISQLIGYGMSLAGCNPTFFKVTGRTSDPANIETYARNTTIRVISSAIKVTDSNTTNSAFIECVIDKQGSPYRVEIVIRTNGLGHPAIEIQTLQPLNVSSDQYSDLCGQVSTIP